MIDDAGLLQARALLKELDGQVEDITRKLETVECNHGRASARGALINRRHAAGLRRELYEAHRLIDGLYSRFPEADQRRFRSHAGIAAVAVRR